MLKILSLTIVLSMLVCVSVTYSQSDSTEVCDMNCCFKDPTPAGVMLGHVHYKGQWMLGYKYMAMNMNDLQHNGNSVSENDIFAANYAMAPQKMNMQMHMLMAMYGISDKFTVMAMGNYFYNTMTMNAYALNHVHGAGAESTSTNHEMQSAGLADAKLYTTFRVLEKNGMQFIPALGLNVPLGKINTKFEGETMPYNMQLGTGTWDGLWAFTYLHEKNDFEWGVQATSSVRFYKNKANYQYSNDYTGNLWLSYYWSEHISSSIRAESMKLASIIGEDKTMNNLMEPGADSQNFGGIRNNIYLGSNIYLQNNKIRNHRLGFEIGIPVYQNLRGYQMNSNWNLNVNWGFTM